MIGLDQVLKLIRKNKSIGYDSYIMVFWNSLLTMILQQNGFHWSC